MALKHGKWFIANEENILVIRRMIYTEDGSRSQERYPVIKYVHLRDKQRDLEDFVIRLNGFDPVEYRTRLAVKFKHAFISPELMDLYREYLDTQVPTKKDAGTLFHYLEDYCLDFFINKLELHDPILWHRNQATWGRYLLNRDENLEKEKLIFDKGRIVSAKVIRYTTYEINRFIKWLHVQRPHEVMPLQFEPLSKAALKDHEARRKLDEGIDETKYIPLNDWTTIRNHLESNQVPWRFNVYLAYHYGLRRAETQGLALTDVKKGHLHAQRQYERKKDGEPLYKPLKNRTNRKVPHWFCDPSEAYKWIEEANKYLIHPDTLSSKFTEMVKHLKLSDYEFHDLRRCFITNAVRKRVEVEELRLAAGHSNIQTTYQYYVKDSRELTEETWKPSA